MSGNGFSAARGGIPMNSVCAALTFEGAAVPFKVADEFAAFQASSSTRTSPES